MKINADFDNRVVVHSEEMEWLSSPMKGVERRPLDRIGGEVARATSIVRYAPESKFSPHVHTGGEEFVVLEGVFQDEHGDFPAGSYIRNPPQSSHTPGSDLGCIIFVKLWQFEPEDRKHVQINTQTAQAEIDNRNKDVSVTPLYIDEHEEVFLQQWKPNTNVTIEASTGLELLVLEGEFTESGEQLKKYSWLRLPIGVNLNAKAGAHGAKVWVKRNHLGSVEEQIQRVEAVSA